MRYADVVSEMSDYEILGVIHSIVTRPGDFDDRDIEELTIIDNELIRRGCQA